MKKNMANIAVLATISAFLFFLPALPKAQAASIDENKLLEVLSDEKTTAAIQEFVRVGTEIKQGNTSELRKIIFRNALEKAGFNGSDIELIINNMKDIDESIISDEGIKDLTKAVGDVVKERVKGIAKEKVKEKAKEEAIDRFGRYFAPYQDVILALANLLGQDIITPQTVKQNDKLTGSPKNYKKIIDMTATAYAPGPLDNGIWNDKTYVGGKVKKGVVAVDPKVIPMGTKLWVEGYGQAVAEDQGSAIKGNRIDLAFDKRAEALDYGIKTVKVYILE